MCHSYQIVPIDRRALAATHEDRQRHERPKQPFHDFTTHWLFLRGPFLGGDPWFENCGRILEELFPSSTGCGIITDGYCFLSLHNSLPLQFLPVWVSVGRVHHVLYVTRSSQEAENEKVVVKSLEYINSHLGKRASPYRVTRPSIAPGTYRVHIYWSNLYFCCCYLQS